ncbi:hypothetical protein B7494_g7664 [Chlorociboria aeruginascens]|nr:hypothetical protein B7494_g7664 [Chlorociboria aeruginascens]
MPRRPAPLQLPASSMPKVPTLLHTTTNPSSPRTPLTPPSRLHLRTLLPSPLSPVFAVNSRPPQPQTPYPWIWRCHICHSVYQLGVTRRCLADGHYFCSLPSLPPSPGLGKGKAKGRKRKRGVRGCRAEFDYAAWDAWNRWREEVRFRRVEAQDHNGNPSQGRECNGVRTRNASDEDNETCSAILRTFHATRNCHRFCNYPSECVTKLREKQEACLQREQEREKMEVTRMTHVPSLFEKLKGSKTSHSKKTSSKKGDRGGSEKGDARGKSQSSFPALEPLGPYSSFLDPDPESSFLPPSLSSSSQSTTSSTWERSASASTSGAKTEINPLYQDANSNSSHKHNEQEISPIAELADNNEGFATAEHLNGMRRKSIAKIAQLTGLDLGWMVGAEGGMGTASGNDNGERSPTSPLRKSFLESEVEDGEEVDRELYGVEYEKEEGRDSEIWVGIELDTEVQDKSKSKGKGKRRSK